MRILTIGASGFIGSHVIVSARSMGQGVEGLSSVRVQPLDGDAEDPAAAWRDRHPKEFVDLCRDLTGFDVVVNAAGVADPARAADKWLTGANAVQPAVVADACRRAGVRRLVHVSTAAVQGTLDPLDETTTYRPLSPYAASKVEAERLLLDPARPAPPEVIVYRPGSVHGAGRAVTRALARVARAPAVPVSGRGDQTLPVDLVENVAAGIVFAATASSLGSQPSRLVVLHPCEGITPRRLLEVFAARRIVSLPEAVTDATLRALGPAAARSPRLGSRLRWLELFWRGQSVRADRLRRAGFSPPVGEEGWFELGRQFSFGAAGSGLR